jgi:hypothetical protein
MYLRKKWVYNEAVRQVFTNFKKASDSVTRKVFLSILVEFGTPVKLTRLMEMCLNEIYSRVRVCQHLSDPFHIKNDLQERDALSPLFCNFA